MQVEAGETELNLRGLKATVAGRYKGNQPISLRCGEVWFGGKPSQS